MSKKLILAVAIAALLSGGCATEGFLNTKQNALKDEAEYSAAWNKAVPDQRVTVVSENPGFWISKQVMPQHQLNTKDVLPAVFDQKVSIAYEPRATARTIGRLISQSAGIPVNFTPDAAAAAAAPIFNNALKIDERLGTVLDDVAQRADISWRYTNGGVEFFALETKVFHIVAVPGSSDFKATMGAKSTSTGSTSGSGSTGSTITSDSGQTLSVGAKIDMFAALKEEIRQVISPTGKFALSDSTGTLVVTDHPRAIKLVETYVNAFNENRMKQVMVAVKVYTVTMNSSENYGLDWSLVYKNLSEAVAIGLRSPNYASQAAYNAITGIVNLTTAAPAGSTGLNMMILDNGQRTKGFYGSDALLTAVSKQGAASLLTSVAAVTTSGESVPVNVTKETSYLASISTTTVYGGTAQASLTPGTITTGFSMNLLPKILPNDGVFLQAAIDLSALDNMASITSAGQTIQIPEKSVRSFLQKVNLKSGQTLVIGGFQLTGTKYGSSGVLEPDMNAAGGSRTADNVKTTLIVTITPFIMHPGQKDGI